MKDYSLESSPANELRQTQNACDDAWITDFLLRAQVGYIATRWDDQPFITPINFWFDKSQKEIYFHTYIEGRLRANIERHPRVCFAASETGSLLTSNKASGFSIQYASVMVFGTVSVLVDDEAKERSLYGLITKYFPNMYAGEHYRPLLKDELKKTAVYGLHIESWSGKRNWPEVANQIADWHPLE